MNISRPQQTGRGVTTWNGADRVTGPWIVAVKATLYTALSVIPHSWSVAQFCISPASASLLLDHYVISDVTVSVICISRSRRPVLVVCRRSSNHSVTTTPCKPLSRRPVQLPCAPMWREICGTQLTDEANFVHIQWKRNQPNDTTTYCVSLC